MEEKIAIVIPAYKCRFLRQTLDSIVVQTCRSFTVYIGDDASPQNLKEIVSDYADKMNIVYRRFDTNLGGVDLPGHWDRCIALAKEPVRNNGRYNILFIFFITRIQIAPLAFMRGRTLNDAVVILDEAQNTTTQQIKMFLTRMGMNILICWVVVF